jgi:uncharacterized protein YuzE
MQGTDTVKLDLVRGKPAQAIYAYDDETGILALRLAGADAGSVGTIELSDLGGGIVLLLTSGGAIDGVEIVVWPVVAPDTRLAPPRPTGAGVVTAPAGVDEIECELSCRVDEGGSTLHLVVEGATAEQTIRVADKLMVDLDEDSELAGIWLLQVPQGVSAAV